MGLAGLAVAIAVTLSDKQRQRLAGTNDSPPTQPVQQIGQNGGFCQAETIFGDTHGIRILALTGGKPGPPISVLGGEGSRHFMAGSRLAGWHEGWIVIPTQAVPRTVADGVVCLTNHGATPVSVMGYGRTVRFEYVRGGNESWWSIAPAVARRMGVGKAQWIGTWSVWLVIFVLLAAAALAAWALARRPVPS